MHTKNDPLTGSNASSAAHYFFLPSPRALGEWAFEYHGWEHKYPSVHLMWVGSDGEGCLKPKQEDCSHDDVYMRQLRIDGARMLLGTF